MENSVKTLQTNLAQDLVKLENSDINEETLNKIEDTYQNVYDIISKIYQRKD
jgi:hypothetical protein